MLAVNLLTIDCAALPSMEPLVEHIRSRHQYPNSNSRPVCTIQVFFTNVNFILYVLQYLMILFCQNIRLSTSRVDVILRPLRYVKMTSRHNVA